MQNTQLSMRAFVRTSLTTAGAMAVTRYSTVSAAALGANDRITMGVIGVGGQGTGHVNGLVDRGEKDNVRVAAVCDVYHRRISRAQEICKGDGYSDYRKLLERTDIDAVLIATPDHWHAQIAMDAIQAGKHVYVEKPMTHSIEQALALRNAVRQSDRVLQVGPNAAADDSYWIAREALGAGKIGKYTWAQASYNRNARVCLFNEHQKPDPTAGPDKTGEDFVDWDLWLGHAWGLAPKIPWNPDHCFRFRKYWPYSGGVATDLLYHKLAPLLIAMAGPDGMYPQRVNACGGLYIEKDGRDIPDVFMMNIDYPGEFTVSLTSTLTNDTQVPERVYGKHGTLEIGGGIKTYPNGDFAEEFMAANNGEGKVHVPAQERRDMVGNFLDSVRGLAKPFCNVELGASTMVAIRMAVDSYRNNKTYIWDAQQEKEIG